MMTVLKLKESKITFVYCWTDWATNKLYLGSHKGGVDDGYVCSSKHMLYEYKQRSQDFTRQIIATGINADMRHFEAIILLKLKAAKDPQFYNKINSYPTFCPQETISTFHKHQISEANKKRKLSPETKEKISKALKGKPLSEETKRKIKEAIAGEKHPMWGRKHSNETKKKIGLKSKGRTQSKETLQKRIQRGSKSHFAKTNMTEVTFMRANKNKYSLLELSHMFNLCTATVYKILNDPNYWKST